MPIEQTHHPEPAAETEDNDSEAYDTPEEQEDDTPQEPNEPQFPGHYPSPPAEGVFRTCANNPNCLLGTNGDQSKYGEIFPSMRRLHVHALQLAETGINWFHPIAFCVWFPNERCVLLPLCMALVCQCFQSGVF